MLSLINLGFLFQLVEQPASNSLGHLDANKALLLSLVPPSPFTPVSLPDLVYNLLHLVYLILGELIVASFSLASSWEDLLDIREDLHIYRILRIYWFWGYKYGFRYPLPENEEASRKVDEALRGQCTVGEAVRKFLSQIQLTHGPS
jgi:hypothetical protein